MAQYGNIKPNPAYPVYREVVSEFPTVLTATTTASPVYPGVAFKWVTAWSLRIRSMGTASYVAVGDRNGQPWRLITVGQTFGVNANPGEVFDLARVFIVSDTSDATVELSATYLPVPQYGNVILADGQR